MGLQTDWTFHFFLYEMRYIGRGVGYLGGYE